MSSRQRVRQFIWRQLRLWRYRLFGRHRHGRQVLEYAGQTPILVLPQVLNPVLFRTGQFLAETLDRTLVPPEALVLDMGTGSGIGAIFAARLATTVVAVDVNPHAVRCARINVLLNGVDDRVVVLEGSLFAPVGDRRFDIVLFNPPYLPGVARDPLGQAFYGTGVMEGFAAGLRDHLTDGGYALLLLSTDGDEAGCLTAMTAHGFSTKPIATRDLGNEVLTVYRCRHEA